MNECRTKPLPPIFVKVGKKTLSFWVKRFCPPSKIDEGGFVHFVEMSVRFFFVWFPYS